MIGFEALPQSQYLLFSSGLYMLLCLRGLVASMLGWVVDKGTSIPDPPL